MDLFSLFDNKSLKCFNCLDSVTHLKTELGCRKHIQNDFEGLVLCLRCHYKLQYCCSNCVVSWVRIDRQKLKRTTAVNKGFIILANCKIKKGETLCEYYGLSFTANTMDLIPTAYWFEINGVAIFPVGYAAFINDNDINYNTKSDEKKCNSKFVITTNGTILIEANKSIAENEIIEVAYGKNYWNFT